MPGAPVIDDILPAAIFMRDVAAAMKLRCPGVVAPVITHITAVKAARCVSLRAAGAALLNTRWFATRSTTVIALGK